VSFTWLSAGDNGITTALWGARRPDQLQPVDDVIGWSIDAASMAEIDQIPGELIKNPWGLNSWRPGMILSRLVSCEAAGRNGLCLIWPA
jgi:hypothetical protein